jgi:hypothetical protein
VTGAPARLLAGLLLAATACAGTLADLARTISGIELDPEECYRVRDLSLSRDDVRLYFTDGHLIFAKPIEGVRVAAVFVADVEGGDAEILVLPPDRGERQSLAAFTQTPNLNEHFKTSVLIFTDETYAGLAAQMRENAANRKAPDMGLILAPNWRTVVRNLSSSFESRLVLDLLSEGRKNHGFFYAAIGGTRLGNFDVVYDPRGQQHIAVGQVNQRDDRLYFDTWTVFESRPGKNPAVKTALRGNEITLSDYRIDATLVPPDLRLRVVTKAKLKPMAAGERAYPFEISPQMKITSATIDGRPAEILERDSLRANLIRNTGNSLFLLMPESRLEAGREYELEIHHEGAVIAEVGNKVFAVLARGSWYPQRGAQFSRFDLTFRYPSDLDLVSTGEPVSDVTEGETRITRRRTAAPVRFVGFNLGQFERASTKRGGITVEVYANRGLERWLQTPRPAEPAIIFPPPGGPRRSRDPLITPLPPEPPPPKPAARLDELAADIAGALEFMTTLFGPPPLKTLTVSPVPGTFGQGFPGLIYLSTLSYFAPRDRPLTRMSPTLLTFFTELLAAHETAHQWWGNVVTAAGYRDEWWLEALANYAALMYLEKRKGTKALDAVLERYRENLLEKGETGRTVESTGPITMGVRLHSSQSPGAWRTVTYEKGAWILHMLRRRMGDARFASFLRELRERFETRALTNDAVRKLAAGFLPPKSLDPALESFFDQWIYGTGIPALQMTHSVKGKAPAFQLSGVVTQTGVGEDFTTLAPIEIQTGKAKIVHWVRTGSDPAPFTLTLKQAPTRVVLDPQGSVLAVKR